MILHSLSIDADAFEARTGWTVKPQGACKGDVCVPVPSALQRDGTLDASVISERLGMPLVADDTHSLWALGPESVTGRALTTAYAPEVELPDLDGKPFRVSSLRPLKVVLVAWASW
jgi:hypothetical protein